MLSDYTPTQGFVAEGFDGGTTFALTGENAGHWVEGAPSAALTTDDVRNRHAEYVTEEGGVMERVAKRNAEFDHWLAAHDAAVRADMQREIRTVEELRKDLAECGRLAGQIMFPEDAEAARTAILDVTRKYSWLPVTPSTPNQQGAEQ